MRMIWNKGHRIRASDKHLVYHFSIGTLLFVFVAVLLLLNIKQLIYYYPDCETMTDVAYYYIDELQALGDIPPSLQNYIDYEAYGRDLDMGGCFIETSRGMCEIPY